MRDQGRLYKSVSLPRIVDPVLIVVGLLIAALAGAVQGLTGFGSGLIMVPVLSLFLSPREVVPVTVLLGTVINIGVLIHARKHLKWKAVLPLFLSAAIAIPLGTYLLMVMSPPALRIVIGAVVLITSAALLLGLSVRIDRERLASIPVGILSGLLQGSVTMSGPPVILFFQNQKMPRDSFRANLVAYFLATNIITIGIFAAGGIMTPSSALPAIYLLPGLLLGLALGIFASGRIPEARFRRIALLLVAAAGISSLVSGIMGLSPG